MIDWPLTLPQTVVLDGYSNPFPDAVIRTQMEAGPDFVRRRSTAAPEPATWSIRLTPAQVDILKNFYEVTLDMGALRFNFPHPRLKTTVAVRFTAAPDPKPVAGLNRWTCALNLEVLP